MSVGDRGSGRFMLEPSCTLIGVNDEFSSDFIFALIRGSPKFWVRLSASQGGFGRLFCRVGLLEM